MQQHNPLSMEARAFADLKAKLAEAFGLEEDDEAVIDTADGQSTLSEMILSSIRYAKRREAYAEAVGAIIADNRRRQQRHQIAANNIRVAVAQAMSEAGLPKVEAADISITQRRANPSPAVIDEALLPEWATKTKISVSADKAAINARWSADPEHFECPGVVIANGEVGITVRTK
jgi:hypothetical protein